MDFNNIIGQEEVISGLKNSIANNKVGHAYIFNGPKGIGKKTTAGIFANLLLCERPKDYKSCGECLPCRMTASGTNPDLHVIESDTSSILIEEIRRIQGETVIRPLYSNRKVYLIIDADKMTTQAQNCLLKTLEEPPDYSVIILTTSNYDALIETVRSRAIKYSFKKNTLNQVLNFLKTKLGENFEGVDFMASYADGVIGTALELAGSDEFISIRNKTIDIVLKMKNSKLTDAFEAYHFFEQNKNNIDTIMDIMLLVYRDMLIAKRAGNENILINSDKKDIIFNSVSNLPLQKIMKNIEEIEATRKNIKQNANFQLAIEVMLMKVQEEYS